MKKIKLINWYKIVLWTGFILFFTTCLLIASISAFASDDSNSISSDNQNNASEQNSKLQFTFDLQDMNGVSRPDYYLKFKNITDPYNPKGFLGKDKNNVLHKDGFVDKLLLTKEEPTLIYLEPDKEGYKLIVSGHAYSGDKITYVASNIENEFIIDSVLLKIYQEDPIPITTKPLTLTDNICVYKFIIKVKHNDSNISLLGLVNPDQYATIPIGEGHIMFADYQENKNSSIVINNPVYKKLDADGYVIYSIKKEDYVDKMHYTQIAFNGFNSYGFKLPFVSSKDSVAGINFTSWHGDNLVTEPTYQIINPTFANDWGNNHVDRYQETKKLEELNIYSDWFVSNEAGYTYRTDFSNALVISQKSKEGNISHYHYSPVVNNGYQWGDDEGNFWKVNGRACKEIPQTSVKDYIHMDFEPIITKKDSPTPTPAPEMSLQTTIKFVDENIEGNNNNNISASTWDATMWFVLIFIAICFCALGYIFFKGKNSYAVNSRARHYAFTMVNKVIIAISIVSTVIVISIICSIFIQNNVAIADNNATLTPSLRAVVNDSDEISIDNAEFNCTQKYHLKNITTSFCKDIKPMNDVHWKICSYNKELYNDIVPNTNRLSEDFNGKYSFTFDTDMEHDLAKTLVGMDVVVVTFNFGEDTSLNPAIVPPDNIEIYSGQSTTLCPLKQSSAVWEAPNVSDCDVLNARWTEDYKLQIDALKEGSTDITLSVPASEDGKYREGSAKFNVVVYKKFPHHEILNDYSWEELKMISNAISNGTIPKIEMQHFEKFAQKAQTKTIPLHDEDGNEVDDLCVRIIDFKHDIKTDSNETSGITFMAAHSINKGYIRDEECIGYARGWKYTTMRKELNPDYDGYSTIWNMLPLDLQSQIQSVTKKSHVGWISGQQYVADIDNTDDKVFLPSGCELGSSIHDPDGSEKEGSIYKYARNDPFMDYWSSKGTAATEVGLNHFCYNYLLEHGKEYDDADEAFLAARKAYGFRDYFGTCWLRSVNAVEDPMYSCLAGALHVWGIADNNELVQCNFAIAPCFCL